MLNRALVVGLLMGLAAVDAQGTEDREPWIAGLRADCDADLQVLGYSNSRADAICSCYVDKLEEQLAEDAAERQELEASGETVPPQEIDAHNMAMSCM